MQLYKYTASLRYMVPWPNIFQKREATIRRCASPKACYVESLCLMKYRFPSSRTATGKGMPQEQFLEETWLSFAAYLALPMQKYRIEESCLLKIPGRHPIG